MRNLPIRVRLTLLYSLIYGILLIGLTTTIYVFHHNSHYGEMDHILTSVTEHVHEELDKQLRKGTPLTKIQFSYDEFVLDGVYIAIKDKNGQTISTNVNTIQLPESPFLVQHVMKETLHTISDQRLGRYRMIIRPVIYQNHMVGYIVAVISLNELDTALYRFAWFVAGMTVLGLIFVTWIGWILAKKSLDRVELIRQTAKTIASSQGFHQRVMHDGPADELGQLVATFNEMLESLEKAYESQKRFIADASHELRAPLTTIRGNLDILCKMKQIPQSEQEEMLRDMQNETIRMSKLVSELLSLARADVGQEIPMQVVDVTALLKDIYADIQAWHTDIDISLDTEGSLFIWGNTDTLKQLFLILLDNAIRYTPVPGKVALTASVELQYVSVRIRDTGIGMSDEQIQHIFDRFYRGDQARTMAPEGTGLGLSIAKWITEQHKGRLIVTSSPGKGSEFQILLFRVRW